jgi:DNA-binding SARP family transcriptional activator
VSTEKAQVRVRLLGPFSVTSGAREAGPWPRPTARRLCQLVLVSPGRRISRDLACEELFPGQDPRTAARSVSKALSMARAALAVLGPAADGLLAADLTHIWAAPDAAVDAEETGRSLRAALALDPGRDRDAQLSAALASPDELLADEPYADWAQRPRERLESLRQEARLALARDRSRGAGQARPEAVLAAWEACFEHDPAALSNEALSNEALSNEARPDGARPDGAGARLRIGLETGPAVLGPIGGGGRVEYGAVGEVVSLAATLQVLARPGYALVGPVTRAAVGSLFTWGEPVPAGTVTATYLGQPRPGAAGSRPRARRGPLVGRSAELAALGTALREAVRGRGSVVLVTGEPGLGKTRLVQEARRRAPAGTIWLEGRCASYASSTPYGLYQQLLATWAKVTPDQTERVLRPALEHALAAVQGHDVLPFLARMMGLPARLVAAGPVVLVLEDLHWADPTSLRLTLDLAGLAAGRRLLVLATSRTPLEGPALRVNLEPLPEAAEAELARSLVGVDATREVLDAVLASADGNPLFLEERLASLLETRALVRGRADEYLEQALVMAERIGERALLGKSLLGLALTALRRHDADRVRVLLPRIMAIADGMAPVAFFGGVMACQAWLAWRDGRRDDVIKLSAEVAAVMTDPEYPWAYHGLVHQWPLIAVHLDAGDVAAAIAAVRALPRYAPPLPADLRETLTAATTAWDTGAPDPARAHLTAALTRARTLHYL